MSVGDHIGIDTFTFVTQQAIGDLKPLQKKIRQTKNTLLKHGQGYKMQKTFIQIVHEGAQTK